MCGILAQWNRDGKPVDVERFARAVSTLADRGPDDEGYVLINTRTGEAQACVGRSSARDVAGGLPEISSVQGRFDLALGHRRLSVVDVSADGHQPMRDPSTGNWVVFNGMIYNFAELRDELSGGGYAFRTQSDTEVLLAAYARWGRACLEHLNGMWAFVLWDHRERELFVARDRLGIKPLVRSSSGDRFAAASDVRALHAAGGCERGIDRQALHHYLSFMEVPAPYSIRPGAAKLQPGRLLRVSRGTIEVHRYWDPQPAFVQRVDAAEAEAQLESLLRDSIRLRLRGDVRVGAFVSGGIDSGMVATLAAEGAPGSLPTYTIAAPEQPEIDESAWAKRVSDSIGGDHHEIPLRADDFTAFLEQTANEGEPFAVSSVLGVRLVAEAAKGECKVLLAGDGSDEILAGYTGRQVEVDECWDTFGERGLARFDEKRATARAEACRLKGRTRVERIRMRAEAALASESDSRDRHFARLRCMFSDPDKRVLYARDWARAGRLEPSVRWLTSGLRSAEDCRGDRLLRRQLLDVDTMIHDEMTSKLDRGTMAWGIEGRVPFLDHRVVEFCLSLPPELRYAQGRGKFLLRRIAARLLPQEIIERPKSGFTIPVEHWFRGPCREQMRDVLSPERVARGGVFDPRAVSGLIDWFEANPDYHSAHMLLIVLMFEMWRAAQSAGAGA